MCSTLMCRDVQNDVLFVQAAVGKLHVLSCQVFDGKIHMNFLYSKSLHTVHSKSISWGAQVPEEIVVFKSFFNAFKYLTVLCLNFSSMFLLHSDKGRLFFRMDTWNWKQVLDSESHVAEIKGTAEVLLLFVPMNTSRLSKRRDLAHLSSLDLGRIKRGCQLRIFLIWSVPWYRLGFKTRPTNV